MNCRLLTVGNSRQSGPFGPAWRGFTLLELLVAFVILTIVLTLTMEILIQTTNTTRVSDQQMETSAAARIALEALGKDIGSAMLGGGATMLFSSGGNNADPSLGFLTTGRARFTANARVAGNLRGSVVAYKMRDFELPVSGKNQTIRVLGRADGRLAYWEKDSTEKTDFDLGQIFRATALPADLSSATGGGDENTVSWTPLGTGVLRFDVGFLLDDGTITQTPPHHLDFGTFPGGSPLNTGSAIPVAFAAANSADVNKRYVKALIVSLAVLDAKTRDLAFKTQILDELRGVLGNPPAGRIAADFWNGKLTDLSPVTRKSIRFYKRTYFIN